MISPGYRRTFAPHDIQPNMVEICEVADQLQSGCFICIHGYRNSDGEVADYWLNYGRDYVRKEHLIEKLKAILWKHEPFSLDVEYLTWVDDKGEHTSNIKPKKTRKRETKVRMETLVERKGLTVENCDVLAGVLRRMLRSYAVHQMNQVRSGTVRRFDKIAKGIYTDHKGGNLHFRMSTLVWKVIREPSVIKHHSTLKGAIGQAVRDKFLKLKAFKLGQFESMSIGGRQLLWSEVAERIPELEQVEALKGGTDEG